MDIADCYRVLGLTSLATAQEIKTSYRRLARKWHPDINPDNQHAHEMFIRVTEAYKVLLTVVPQNPPAPNQSAPARSSPSPAPQNNRNASSERPAESSRYRTRPQPRSEPPASSHQARHQSTDVNTRSRPDPAYQVKLKAYEQLQHLLQMKRYPRAVASIEALSQKLPGDPEIRQWQAIIYQRWGRQLIAERKYNQARAYLKKASATDPHNKSLLAEINQDLRTIQMSV